MTCGNEHLETLVLAHRLLIAQAIELGERYDAMAALHSAPFDRIRPSDEDESRIRRRFDDLDAQMRMLPPLAVYLEQRMRAAKRRLA